ncbi:MAG: sigma-54 dependent transcriptional regulator [Desulfococcaceae bacterium]|nr:sigma-54 dependent transcriptional regulator [Desulfococcaceae bacterium]
MLQTSVEVGRGGLPGVFGHMPERDSRKKEIKKVMQKEPFFLAEGIVGRGEAMRKVLEQIRQFAASDASVLIYGETGTGKELLARVLHSAGPRADGPFVRISCSEIPEGLMETHLFGYARGAFTGAGEDRPGLFESADRGTVFLDDIADIPLHIQVKLLRAVDNREFTRIGDRVSRKSDFRLVSAVSRDMYELIREGRFREDLAFRLRGVTIRVPPLRERTEDIPLLADYFVRNCKPGMRISDDVCDILTDYLWPGNVRQLKNLMEYTATVCRTDTITRRDIPAGFGDGVKSADMPDLKKLTRDNVLGALKESGWNRSAAARLLGCSRSTLYRKAGEFRLFDLM